MEQILSKFLNGVGDKLYRDLIEHYIQNLSKSKLQEAVLEETSLLPVELQVYVMDYIDIATNRFSYEKAFWEGASCKQAVHIIIDSAMKFLPLKGYIPTIWTAYEPQNEGLTFHLFQIPTLSIAYSASTQKAQRKFMGIKKGFFG